mmetsp:Transcript_71790/g.207954  ORF Transcript_71790/g.207954 Transcript_71790/m.207954 type:complete len:225 (-) Transcript_71790:1834-2508(-)
MDLGHGQGHSSRRRRRVLRLQSHNRRCWRRRGRCWVHRCLRRHLGSGTLRSWGCGGGSLQHRVALLARVRHQHIVCFIQGVDLLLTLCHPLLCGLGVDARGLQPLVQILRIRKRLRGGGEVRVALGERGGVVVLHLHLVRLVLLSCGKHDVDVLQRLHMLAGCLLLFLPGLRGDLLVAVPDHLQHRQDTRALVHQRAVHRLLRDLFRELTVLVVGGRQRQLLRC